MLALTLMLFGCRILGKTSGVMMGFGRSSMGVNGYSSGLCRFV
jgi:hypothetical protein